MSLYERLFTPVSNNSIIVETISAFALKELSLMVNNVENKPLICLSTYCSSLCKFVMGFSLCEKIVSNKFASVKFTLSRFEIKP